MRGRLIVFLLADKLVTIQLLAPLVGRLAQLEVSLGFIRRGRELRFIETNEQVALFHRLAFGKQDLLESPIRFGLYLDHFVGRNRADEGECFVHRLNSGLGHHGLHNEDWHLGTAFGRLLFAARCSQHHRKQGKKTDSFHR